MVAAAATSDEEILHSFGEKHVAWLLAYTDKTRTQATSQMPVNGNDLEAIAH